MEKLSRFQTKDDVTNRIQDQNIRVLNPLLSNPVVQGHVLSDLPLSSGTNNVNHGLGRAPLGWQIVRINAPATIVDLQATNTISNLTLVLSSSANTTASIYVF